MKVIILAADLDLSLDPTTTKKPKAFLEVRGKPILVHLIENVSKIKPTSITVITNDLFYEEFINWSEKRKNLPPVTFLSNGADLDYKGQGVVYDLYDLIRSSKINDQEIYLILPCNCYFDYPLNHFLLQALHHVPKPVIACYDVKTKDEAKKFSVIQMDSNYHITDLKEKPALPESTLIDAGIYLFPRGILLLLYEYLRMQNRNPRNLTDFVTWLVRRQAVIAVPIEGEVIDGLRYFESKGGAES